MLKHLLDDICKRRAKRLSATSRYRDQLCELPTGLFDHWAATASQQFQGIPRDALFYMRSAEALMAFFDCVTLVDKPCALPSKAADSVWHAWLQYSPMSLQQFCLKHFKRMIPHREAPDMPAPMGEAMANCLVGARRLSGLMPGGPTVPPLFATDRRLRMPHGYAYRVVRGKVGVADIDASGRRWGDIAFPAGLLPSTLLACGLVHGWEIPDPRRHHADAGDATAGGGASANCDGAGDGGGGGDGGGSGCGGGGGCGGG